jgi:hypothetical protein
MNPTSLRLSLVRTDWLASSHPVAVRKKTEWIEDVGRIGAPGSRQTVNSHANSREMLESELPDDGDGMAWKLLAQRGVDMRLPLRFEFTIRVADERSGQIVVARLKNQHIGDSQELVYDPGELEEGEEMTKSNAEFWPAWTVCVCREMLPRYQEVTEFQHTLKRVCDDLGSPDGWTARVP